MTWISPAILAFVAWLVMIVVGAAGGEALVIGAAAVLATSLSLASGLLANRALSAGSAKVSSELTVISERLLRLERLAAAPPRTTAHAAGSAEAPLAADLGVLSRVVADLAETLSGHQRDLEALKASRGKKPALRAEDPHLNLDVSVQSGSSGPDASSASIWQQHAAMPPAADLVSRDDFARAASAILKRLNQEPPLPDPVRESMADGRFEFLLQPVVTLPQRRARFYEASPRLQGPEGGLIAAEEVAQSLDRHDHRCEFDTAVLPYVAAIAQHLIKRDGDSRVAWRIALASLSDPDWLKAALAAFGSAPEAGSRALLILPQEGLRAANATEQASLSRLTSTGLRLVVDQVTDPVADWASLSRLGVAFALVESETLLRAGHESDLMHLVRRLSAAAIGLVATGVDEERAIPDLLDFDVLLAQGTVIGIPRPIRSEVLAMRARLPAASTATAPAPSVDGAGSATPPTAPAPADAPSGSDGRSSFREFLRRAG